MGGQGAKNHAMKEEASEDETEDEQMGIEDEVDVVRSRRKKSFVRRVLKMQRIKQGIFRSRILVKIS